MVNWSVIFLCGIQKKYTAVVPKRLDAITDALIYQFQFSKVSIAIHLFLPNVLLLLSPLFDSLRRWREFCDILKQEKPKSQLKFSMDRLRNDMKICYPTVWRNFILQYKAFNLGLGGERIENVLWRINNKVLPKSRRSVVIHCGTNNIDTSSSDGISVGVVTIARSIFHR